LVAGVAAVPTKAFAQGAAASPATIVINRIAAGPDGTSFVDKVALPRPPGADAAAMVARLYSTDVEIGMSAPGTLIDWHRVSTPRLLVILQGEMEIGTGDGKLTRLKAGDIALAADVTGKGHTSRTVGTSPVMAMTVRLPKDDPLRTRESSCSDGVAARDCVANNLTIHRDGN
jgi:hypothetical protein